METERVQSNNYVIVKSYITGRDIVVNLDPNRFLIPPTFAIERLRQTGDAFVAWCKDLRVRVRDSNLKIVEEAERLCAAQSISDYAAALDGFLAIKRATTSSTEQARTRDLVVGLWSSGCLVFPPVATQDMSMVLKEAWGFPPTVQSMLRSIDEAQTKDAGERSTLNSRRLRSLIILAISRGGVLDAGDLTPEVAASFLESQLKAKEVRKGTARYLVAIQREQFGAAVKHDLHNYGDYARYAEHSDTAFRGLVRDDQTMEEWRAMAEEFVSGNVIANQAAYLTGLNKFLSAIKVRKAFCRRPVDFLRLASIPSDFASLAETESKKIYEFIEWMLDTRASDEDDNGFKVRLPGFRNPMLRPTTADKVRHAETVRDPLPLRFVRMLKDILTEDDYAWAKEAGRQIMSSDYIKWRNPETGHVEEVWSPVRTAAILLKLILPSRTFQIRMLDSGEGDTNVYRPQEGGWVRNTGACKPVGKQTVADGVLFRQRNRDNTEHVFLRFNTNKTADIDKDTAAMGYVMPWHNEEALQVLDWLRNWQEKYNPISGPTFWTDLKDAKYRRTYTQEQLRRRGATHFLFRDASQPDREQPVTDSRLRGLWTKMLVELERRLAESGETMPDGAPIRLVKRTGVRHLLPVFDLHSLRVTMITAMSEAGVPIEVLMKVVGHATIIMTLYYNKISPEHISEHLKAGQERVIASEQQNWQRWLVGRAREELIAAVAHTNPAALEVLGATSPMSWIVRDHGICPVGASRCQEGGPVVIDTSAYRKYAPVPGGAANCVGCRFFVSGPPFLFGLQAHFDSISFRLREASARYQAAKAKFEEIEALSKTARDACEPFPKDKLNALTLASGHYEQATQEVDTLALSFHAAYNLIQQCIHIIRRSPEGRSEREHKFALIALGGMETLEAVLEESTEFEVADSICHSALFFESIDATLPNLRRLRAFDAMLAKNGFDPVFIEMTEQDALAVGNQMSAFLYTRLGRTDANALMSGRETLRRLRFEDDFVRKLESVASMRVLPHGDVRNSWIVDPRSPVRVRHCSN